MIPAVFYIKDTTLDAILRTLVDDLLRLQQDGVAASLLYLINLAIILGPAFFWLQAVVHMGSFLTTSEVEWKGRKFLFRFVYLGTKGDWPFLRSAFKLSCGFNCKRKCHLCDIQEPSQNQSLCLFG